jgi:uncharacterized membrane protein (DUF106 family)
MPPNFIKNCEENKMAKFVYNQFSLGIAIAGVILGAFIYLTSPTDDNNTALQLQEQRIAYQEQTIKDLTKNQQNDTQEVKLRMTDLESEIQTLSLQIMALTTIIDERIPKK